MQKSERCVSTFLAHRVVLRFIVCEGAREHRACLLAEIAGNVHGSRVMRVATIYKSSSSGTYTLHGQC